MRPALRPRRSSFTFVSHRNDELWWSRPSRLTCLNAGVRQRVKMGAVAWGGSPHKRNKPVYHIVRVSGSSSTRLDKQSRAVIASGFLNASEARESAFRWVDRHFPDATYQPDRGQWWVKDDGGEVHLFSIEPTGPEARF